MIYTQITPSVTSYPYPGKTAKAADRTDCIGTTCTYAEEMTNYANWYTYYRTRMQTMKSAASLAFKDIGDDFRVGFMTIHPTASNSLKLTLLAAPIKLPGLPSFSAVMAIQLRLYVPHWQKPGAFMRTRKP